MWPPHPTPEFLHPAESPGRSSLQRRRPPCRTPTPPSTALPRSPPVRFLACSSCSSCRTYLHGLRLLHTAIGSSATASKASLDPPPVQQPLPQAGSPPRFTSLHCLPPPHSTADLAVHCGPPTWNGGYRRAGILFTTVPSESGTVPGIWQMLKKHLSNE